MSTNLLSVFKDMNKTVSKERFTLMKSDTPMMEFTLESYIGDILKVTGIKILTNKIWLFPVSLKEAKEESILKWLKSRFIPRNRAFVRDITKTLGDESILTIMRITKGLTVIDDYWLRTSESEEKTWKEVNLYDNDFDSNIADIAFTGFGDYKVKGVTSSPEFTTDGMLRKVWRRHGDGSIWLYKGGTEGYSNAGNEPYSEFYSAQVAKRLDIPHVDYNLIQFRGVLCSICKNMTTKDVSLVSAYNVWGDSQLDSIIGSLIGRYDDILQSLLDMMVFDFIVANEDRHRGNFGLLYRNKDMTPIGLAPIYDHGLALAPLFVPTKRDAFTELLEYINTKSIGVIGNDDAKWIKSIMTDRMHHSLKKLVRFEFKKHSRYNLDEKRLKLLSQMVQYRARLLLK